MLYSLYELHVCSVVTVSVRSEELWTHYEYMWLCVCVCERECERERDGQSGVSALCQREQAWRGVNFNESSINRRVLWGKSVCDRIRRCRDSLKDTIPRLSRSLSLSVSLSYSYIILCLAPCRGQVPGKKWCYCIAKVLCVTEWLHFLLTLYFIVSFVTVYFYIYVRSNINELHALTIWMRVCFTVSCMQLCVIYCYYYSKYM